MSDNAYVRWFETLGIADVPLVGGKNASLGEMIRFLKEKAIRVPDGFATTADAYWRFLDESGLRGRIAEALADYRAGRKTLHQTGEAVRTMIRRTELSGELAQAVTEAYRELSRRHGRAEADVAARSSATAEDLPDASFAGQQETFLNVTGEKELLAAVRDCFASLFTDRAISYRQEKGFDDMKVALSVGVQKMVRSDKAAAGVMFSIDTETGFPRVMVIDGAWGLGENVVKGVVTPDEFRVFKPLLDRPELKPIIEKTLGSKEKKLVYSRAVGRSTQNVDTPKDERLRFVLSDEEILELARWGVIIEAHYGKPMDMEWAKDGDTGELFIVQARPETVQSRRAAGALQEYVLKEQGERLVEGLAVGDSIASGKVCLIKSAEDIDQFEEGAVLVTQMTDPDWVPIMKRAAGIVTDSGGRTCHAAIVSRELGIPAIVGTGKGTLVLKAGQDVTMSCAEGEIGYVYQGRLAYDVHEVSLENLPPTKTRIMMNVASPAAALTWWRLPARGIGLARMEFIVMNAIKVHPMALVRYDDLQDERAKRQIAELTRAFPSREEYFIDTLARGIGRIAASQWPEPVVVRMSDFKTNEYAELIGGRQFEPKEANPMIGFRGASRYYDDRYRAGFALECRAIGRVRDEMGFDNVIVMIPFCRTVAEADRVLAVMAENGLKRGERGLQVYVMAEIPANVILADRFAERFDGFSIGSNDLTQLTLGVDRDSGDLAHLFDERDEAVKRFVAQLIHLAHQSGSKVGICGQAPSDYPEFAEYLVELGIDSISLNPDSVIPVIRRVAEAEKRLGR